MTKNSWDTDQLNANGELLIGNGSSLPTAGTLTQGTNCTITNGANSITIAASGSAGMTLISTATASSSATIEFTGLTSTYFMYKIIFSNLLPASNSTLYLRTSTNGGSTWDSGASNYNWRYMQTTVAGSTTASGNSSDSQIEILSSLSSAANEQSCGIIDIYNPLATGYCRMIMYGHRFGSATNQTTQHGGAARLAAADVDAIQLLMSTGNIATGTFKLYGLAAS